MNAHQILLCAIFFPPQNWKVLLKKFHVQLTGDIHKKTGELLTGLSQKDVTGYVNHSRKCFVGETCRHNNFITN